MPKQTPKTPSDEPEAVPTSLSDSAGFLLNRAARIIREMVEDALKPLRLSAQEYGLMRLIEIGGPTTQQSLCARNKIDRTTMVQILDHLEERQFVIRQTSSTDRRANIIFLTPRGRKTLSKATRLVKKEQEKFLAPLDTEEWDALRQQLIKLLKHNFENRPEPKSD